MFQTFEPVSDISFARKHLPLLRTEMKKQDLDGFVVPHDDEYQNEYIPEFAERLMWATGFSGSAGAAVIMMNSAVMLTDGRYTLQVRQQADPDYFSYTDITDTPPHAWLTENAPDKARIGYDPMLHTPDSVDHLRAAAKKAGFDLVAVKENLIDIAWQDQPARPLTPAIAHDVKFAGVSSAEKRKQIASVVRDAGADAVLLTAAPSIAWLFNIRGSDVARTPLPLSRALLNADGTATLFIAPEKVDNTLPGFLGGDVDIRAEANVEGALEALGAKNAKIAVDRAMAPSKYVDALIESGASIVKMTDPCALPRARKNDIEIEGARNAHIRDGVAITRFLHWIDENAQSGDVDEITAAKQLESFRRGSNDLRDISFDTISGAGSNGAICHYKVSTATNLKLDRDTLYLVDSGGQYPDGTTDITRTMPIGSPSAEMCDRFTRVLKGHIALATLKFPAGTTGHQLDAFARKPLWDAGLDYDHGTGHGVGSFLGVHEGPQRIAKAPNSQALKPGMILSNEPGYYKADEYGIRIENLIVVSPPTPVKDGEREMMSFETITLAPINLGLVASELLTPDEREWLNQYHSRVRKTLAPLLPDDVQEWFKDATRKI